MGDTLSGIAARHGVSLNSLLRSSGLRASSIIYPGQRITVSGGYVAGKATYGSA